MTTTNRETRRATSKVKPTKNVIKNVEVLEIDGEEYDVPSAVEVYKKVSGYEYAKAQAGDTKAIGAITVTIIDSLPEGDFKELMKTLPAQRLDEVMYLWAGASPENL